MFIVIMGILTMNLLVGIAVDNIKEVLNESHLKRLGMKAKVKIKNFYDQIILMNLFFTYSLSLKWKAWFQNVSEDYHLSKNI